MKLVQKMFVGLSLVGSLTLGSCSKDDVQKPEPDSSVNESSNLKMNGLQPIFLPYFPSTIGNTGLDIFPADWDDVGVYNALEIPVGASTLTHLLGDPNLPWNKPLPPVPTSPNVSTVITLGSAEFDLPFYLGDDKTEAATVITNLKPGKSYQIKFHVAATVRAFKGDQPAYAKYVKVVGEGSFSETIDLNNKEAEWVSKAITFTATKTSQKIRFESEVAQAAGRISFTNILVEQNSIKQLN